MTTENQAISIPEGAYIKINPESDLVILSLLAEANALRDIAEARVIACEIFWEEGLRVSPTR